MRNNTKIVMVKGVQLGGSNSVVIQSMCNIKTSKVNEVVKQINDLHLAGCELVRVSIMDLEDAYSIKEIKKQTKKIAKEKKIEKKNVAKQNKQKAKNIATHD